MANQQIKINDEVIYVGRVLDRTKSGLNYIRRDALIYNIRGSWGEPVKADLCFYMPSRSAIVANAHAREALTIKQKFGQKISPAEIDRVNNPRPETIRVEVKQVPRAADPENPGPHTFILKEDSVNEKQSGPDKKSDHPGLSATRDCQLLQRARGKRPAEGKA